MKEITHREVFSQLSDLVQRNGLARFHIGKWDKVPTCKIIGDPPNSASLVQTDAGIELWYYTEIVDEFDIEQILHELAHYVLGLDEELACYPLALSWALDFHPSVAERIVTMYHEVKKEVYNINKL